MSEPTTYDLIQDTRIQGVEDLVQTTYTPFQGPEFSYPVVHQPMDDEMWQYVTLGVGSGLLDVGGRPYWLRDLSDVTDTGKLTVSTTTGTAQAILRGFYHRLNADMTLSFPPVSQKTVYQVVLEYDPLRHKEPGGPIRVRVLTSLDWSGGKHYLPLWDVERAPSQLLSQAKVTQRRPKITPTITVDRWENRPPEHSQLWGTRLLLSHSDDRGREFIAWGSSDETGGPTDWVPVDAPGWDEYGDTPNYKWPGHGPRRAIQRDGKKRRLRGRVMRGNGSTMSSSSEGYLVWGIGDQDMPAFDNKFVVAGSGNSDPSVGAIIVSGSEVRLYPKDNMSWVDLAGVWWEVA